MWAPNARSCATTNHNARPNMGREHPKTTHRECAALGLGIYLVSTPSLASLCANYTGRFLFSHLIFRTCFSSLGDLDYFMK